MSSITQKEQEEEEVGVLTKRLKETKIQEDRVAVVSAKEGVTMMDTTSDMKRSEKALEILNNFMNSGISSHGRTVDILILCGLITVLVRAIERSDIKYMESTLSCLKNEFREAKCTDMDIAVQELEVLVEMIKTGEIERSLEVVDDMIEKYKSEKDSVQFFHFLKDTIKDIIETK